MSEVKQQKSSSIGWGLIGLMFKLTIWSVMGFAGYMGFMYHKYIKETPIENVLVRGRCIDRETESEVLISSKQVLITEALENGTFDGVVRSTGEEVNCQRKVFVEIFGQFDRLPELLRPKHMVELDPIVEVNRDISQYTNLKNKNLMISGDCSLKGKTETLRQEAMTVYNVKREKGLFYLETLRYRDSEKMVCPYKTVSIAEATTLDVEKAKLAGMTSKDLVGKTVSLTGICTKEGAFEVEKRIRMPMIDIKAKIIDLLMKDGEVVKLRAGVDRNGSIVSCGEMGKFVIEPYIDRTLYGKKDQ